MRRAWRRGVSRAVAPASLCLLAFVVRDGGASPVVPSLTGVYVDATTAVRFTGPGAPGWARLELPPRPDGAWRLPGYDDSAWQLGVGPFVASTPPVVRPGGPPAAPPARHDSLFVRARFDVPHPAAVRGLRFTASYQDGLAAWVNGVEVARANLDPAALPDSPAETGHDLVPETFYVAVPPGLLQAEGNVLALEVHPFGAHLAPTLSGVQLAGAAAPAIVRGPYLARVSATRATVVFDTDLPTPATVSFGPTAGYGESIDDPAGTHHVVELDGLAVDAPVHYRVHAGASDSGDLVFHPLPPRGEPVRFAVFGDVRSGAEVHAELVRDVLADAPDFSLVLGDLVQRGDDQGEWQRYFRIEAPLLSTVPEFPVPGNHDYGVDGDRLFLDAFPMPGGAPEEGLYSFDAGDVHVAVLDSSRPASTIQAGWLDADLARATASGARFLFVALHAGPYSHGEHGPNRAEIATLVPILKEHHVAMVFSGHDHDFERGVAGGLHYLVTGGGGAPLYHEACLDPARCPGTVQCFASAHNYVLVEVTGDDFRVCPRRIDGTALEACSTYGVSGSPPNVATLK